MFMIFICKYKQLGFDSYFVNTLRGKGLVIFDKLYLCDVGYLDWTCFVLYLLIGDIIVWLVYSLKL